MPNQAILALLEFKRGLDPKMFTPTIFIGYLGTLINVKDFRSYLEVSNEVGAAAVERAAGLHLKVP